MTSFWNVVPGCIAAGLLLLAPAPLRAEAAQRQPRTGNALLRQLDDAFSELVSRSSPAVVQVLVSGYGPVAETASPEGAPIARQHSLGSGVIVDPSGYILTNYHVVRNAQRIVVVLPVSGVPAVPEAPDAAKRRTLEAKLVGADRLVDLALLKVEAAGPLAALGLEGANPVRQGELVFAIGSPQGLASTVTMGVVSSISRDVPLDTPMAFIQTDAPINPGNSGGALVNSEGKLVGINTFILSQSGGSQGLGFAIPVPIARIVYESLRKYGRVRRIEAGINTQYITPTLAAGLQLARDWGVVVADVTMDSPAEAAGVKAGDIMETVDGRPIDGFAAVLAALYVHPIEAPLRIGLLRGKKHLDLQLRVSEAKRPLEDLAELATPDKHLVRRLGILALTVDNKLAGLVHLREGTGVVVAARTLDGTSVDSGLQVGDVIHAVNNAKVESLEALRDLVHAAKPGDAMVLQVERQGLYHYLPFEME